MKDRQIGSSGQLFAALRDTKYDVHGMRSIKREQLDALVECAKAAKEFRHASLDGAGRALHKAAPKLDAAIVRLESLLRPTTQKK